MTDLFAWALKRDWRASRSQRRRKPGPCRFMPMRPKRRPKAGDMINHMNRPCFSPGWALYYGKPHD